MEAQNHIFGLYDLKTTDPTHPGIVLKEELESRKITQRKFSEVIGLQYTALNEIVNGKRPISTDFAILLEAALGIEAMFWINMQTRYNISVAKNNKKLSAKINKIKELAALI